MSATPIQRTQSLTERVYDQIERMILSGDMEPGMRLNEMELAEQMAVSRGPVREATRALVKAGLLMAVPARGVFVREMSDKDIAENYDVRALLTGLLCAEAALRRTEAEVAELNRMIADMDAAISEDRIADYYRSNLEFHDLIGRIADHGCAHRIYADLIRETHLLRRSMAAPGQTNDEHRGIVQAIAAGDADLARTRGHDHVLHGKDRWQDHRAP